jgi:hypothetical protein
MDGKISINAPPGSRHAMLYLLVLSSVLLVPLGAAPAITIASNPAQYGYNDKITATTATGDGIILYLNGTQVANATTSTSYTICSSGTCLLPGTYLLTAKDTVTGAKSSQGFTVVPSYPTFSVQSSTIRYGRTDTILGYPAFYNDSTAILIDGSTVISGQGDLTYKICSSASQPCLSIGSHNITVRDTTENVRALATYTLNVTPVPPYISIQSSRVQYGSQDAITATAPTSFDQISIMYGSTTLASGTGTVTYVVCNTTASTSACLVPSNYSIYAYDGSEKSSSPSKNLTVTPLNPQLTISSTSVRYGQYDSITAKAPNPNDAIYISIDGVQVAYGTGNVTYTFCNKNSSTQFHCISAGSHNIYIGDSTSHSSVNSTISISPVLPTVTLSLSKAKNNTPVTITAKAPYYSDSLALIVGNSIVQNGTNIISYTICRDQQFGCLPAGTYSVSVYDRSEGANSTVSSLTLMPSQSASSNSIANTTTNTANTLPANALSTAINIVQPTSTISPGFLGISGANPVEIVIAVIIVIVAAALALKLRNRG